MSNPNILREYETVKNSIGKGGSGFVSLMKKPGIDSLFAVKVFHERLDTTESLRFLHEVETMSSLKHPFLVSVVEYQLPEEANGNQAAIAMEYLPNGSLRDLIKNNKNYNKMQVLWEISCGMSYIHSEGKIHCDLKPENILFDSNMHAKICDFGLSRNEETTMTQGMGTPQYMAPELFQTDHYDHKIDVFAYGQMIIEVLSGEPLFSCCQSFSVLNKMMNFNLPPIPDCIEDPIRSMIEKCRAFDPRERPEFSEIEMLLEDYVEPSFVETIFMREAIIKGSNKLATEAYEAILKVADLEKRITVLREQTHQDNSIFNAIQRNDIEKVKEFIARGANLNETDKVQNRS